MAVPVIGSVLKKVFGTRNERMVKHYLTRVRQINALEHDYVNLSDSELKAMTTTFRERVKAGEKAYDMIPEIFAVAREAMDRSVGIRNIFNPNEEFDPSQLPESAQALYQQTAETIAATEDAEPTGDFKGCRTPIAAWQFVDIPVELYHAVRALYPDSKPPFRARPFDVQLIGGMVLAQGKIAEMKTGEGKTIVAPLASFLASVEHKQIHVITVNDYLVQRDRDWVFPFYRALGLTVGAIHPQHMQTPADKGIAYTCDALYGTTSEFGFDYLRDNMKLRAEEQFQKERNFAIVDEVDSTLIDEARTPLIISGLAHQTRPRYELADQLALHLVAVQADWNTADERVSSCEVAIAGLEGDLRNSADKSNHPEIKTKLAKQRENLPALEAERDRHVQFYEIEMDKKKATVTDEGIAEAQRKSGIGSFYVGENVDMPHLLEQAIRAHTVYQRDRDYVISPDDQGQPSVVIVDQNTGRKMVGRQWSDGLHQAVECKEKVAVKDETQTMATITIQNYFKMYDRLSGMTGTADTEATEFHEIYGLDVISIPTNVPIARSDRNDWVFSTEKGKWQAIVDEVRRYHDAGRPVLVGTTSVEKSETLSQMLTRETRISHEVLNAKQHEREADIVKSAGNVGAVMIATNMAGRGTDIKLAPIGRPELVEHWKKRDLCPREVDPEWEDERILEAVYRHLCIRRCGMKKDEANALSGAEARRTMMLQLADDLADRGLGLKIPKMPSGAEELKQWDKQLSDALDTSGLPPLHRLEMWDSIEALGGLHIVGTERHESRRIDNQLRGRAGRQGDNGSSRFFLSLEDDLMKMFAGKIVNSILSRSGFKEGVVLEAGMLTKSVARAQRKVEERNFQWRKNILEYDEPMEFQRHRFYGMRQPILEGDGIRETIFTQIEDAVWESVGTYLGRDHRGGCISEWVSEQFAVNIEPERFRNKDREDIHRIIRTDTAEESSSEIRVTAAEYMPDEADPEDIDWSGLAEWCNMVYGSSIEASEIQGLDRRALVERFEEAADAKFAAISLDPIDRFLVPEFEQRELAEWSNRKFLTELEASDIVGIEKREQVVEVIMNAAQKTYHDRERHYPVDQAIERAASRMQTDPKMALTRFTNWVNGRFELNWSPNALPSNDPAELRKILHEQADKWDDDRIRNRAAQIAAEHGDADSLESWLNEHLSIGLEESEREALEESPDRIAEITLTAVSRGLRKELTMFERWILLQILDSSWKDNLHQMDQVKDAIGFRSFSQKDPRIEFKREASRLYEEMNSTIRDRVTDVIMRGRMTPQAISPESANEIAQRKPGEKVNEETRRELEAAQAGQPQGARPGTEGAPQMAAAAQRRPSAAAPATATLGRRAGQNRTAKPAPGGPSAKTAIPAIGRNEVVTVINPENGKQEQMKFKKAKPLLEQGWKLG